MGKVSKTIKRKQKQLKNAMQRSETVYRSKRDVSLDEAFDVDLPEEDLPQTALPVIYLEKPPRGSDEGPTAICSCGEWTFGPSTRMMELGKEAKKHALETGHQLRSHE